MDVNNLCISKNGQFYKLNSALSKASIERTFKEISKERVGNYLLNEVKQNLTTSTNIPVTYSVAAFKIESEPSFLTNTATTEHKYAYLLLIEYSDALVVFKKYVEIPDKVFDRFIGEYDYEKFCHLHGQQKPSYERVTMKNMSVSNVEIRSRSLEAKRLNGILPSNSSSRSIPSNFRMKIGQEVYTITPSTARISFRDGRVSLEELVDWGNSMKEEIKTTINSSEFLDNFAAPIILKDVFDKGHELIAVLFDLGELEEKFKLGVLTFNKPGVSGVVPFSGKENLKLLDFFRAPLLVDGNELKSRWLGLDSQLKFTNKLITLKSKPLASITLSEDGKPDRTLASYLNKEKPFSAVFNNPSYSYYSRSCFEDKAMLNNLSAILNVFNETIDFTSVLTEKEKPHASTLNRFPSTSLFRAVEDNYCHNHDIVICDDMNDEWADHIAIDHSSNTPSISFIHSKFTKKDTYGASAFHEVVAQALKNIGRTQADKSLYETKYNRDWSGTYEGTNIERIRGAQNWNDIENALDAVSGNPNSVKKIILATPFLKKSKLATELNKLAQGQQARPHYVQLVWLLNSFISSCKDFGVQAHILCKP